jgi:hypothetical protein
MFEKLRVSFHVDDLPDTSALDMEIDRFLLASFFLAFDKLAKARIAKGMRPLSTEMDIVDRSPDAVLTLQKGYVTIRDGRLTRLMIAILKLIYHICSLCNVVFRALYAIKNRSNASTP